MSLCSVTRVVQRTQRSNWVINLGIYIKIFKFNVRVWNSLLFILYEKTPTSVWTEIISTRFEYRVQFRTVIYYINSNIISSSENPTLAQN